MPTATVPLLVIAPNHARFERWCRDHGLPRRLVRFISSEHYLRGVADRHLVIVDSGDCPPRTRQLLADVRHLAERYRLTVHYSTTEDRPVPSGEDLRAKYGDQAEMLRDATPVLNLIGRDDINPHWAVAFRYATMEALDAFRAGNRQHYGYETIGPVIGPDGLLYGVTVPPDPPDLPAGLAPVKDIEVQR
jgi:hypothetical protein